MLTLVILGTGKPHPRWAESSFRDGDPNEKWHSRATKCVPLTKRRAHSPELVDDHSTANGRNGVISSLLTPIKTEAPPDPSPQLYRFSPSPAPSMRYHTFQADVRASSASSFDNEQRPPYSAPSSSGSYHTTSSAASGSYNHHSSHPTSGTSPYSDGGSTNYPLSGSDDGRAYAEHYTPSTSPAHSFCHCRANPAMGNAYISLSQQLQSTLNSLRQYNQHPSNSQCLLYRRISELHNLMQYVPYCSGTGIPTLN